MNVYELVTFKHDLDKSSKKLNSFYEAGLQYYFAQNWKEGFKYFSTVLKYRPHDMPSQLMSQRCIEYQKAPPPPEWSGVFIQSSK